MNLFLLENVSRHSSTVHELIMEERTLACFIQVTIDANSNIKYKENVEIFECLFLILVIGVVF